MRRDAHRSPPLDGDEARRRRQGLVALVFVQGCFGLFPVLVKVVIDPAAGLADLAPAPGGEVLAAGQGFSPRALVVWRVLVAALVLTTLALRLHGRGVFVSRRDVGRLALCSFFGVFANQWLALEGMARSRATVAGVLMTLIPVFTYVVAILARQERVSGRRAGGIAVALAGGVGLLLAQARGEPSAAASDPLLGGLLIVTNCLSYAVYLVLARALLLRLPPLAVIAWTFVLALPWLPVVGAGAVLWPSDPDPRALWALALLLLLPTVIGYALNAWALARVSASTTAVFVYLQPVVAGATGMAVLGERPALATWLATAVLFAGIWLVISGRRRGSVGAQDAVAVGVRGTEGRVAP